MTPPAELLEVTHQLARGDHSNWYQIFKDNPHLLNQFLEYYGAYMKSVPRGGGGGQEGEESGGMVSDRDETRWREVDQSGRGRFDEGERSEDIFDLQSTQLQPDVGSTHSIQGRGRGYSEAHPSGGMPQEGAGSGGVAVVEEWLRSSEISMVELKGILDQAMAHHKALPTPAMPTHSQDISLEPHPLESPYSDRHDNDAVEPLQSYSNRHGDNAHLSQYSDRHGDDTLPRPPDDHEVGVVADKKGTGLEGGEMDMDIVDDDELYTSEKVGGAKEDDVDSLYGEADQPLPVTTPPNLVRSDAGVQTCVEEGLDVPPPPGGTGVGGAGEGAGLGEGGRRVVEGRHRDLQMQALRSFTSKSQALITSTHTFIR